MKTFSAVLIGVLLLAALCAAQDATTSPADQDVAAAARANRAPKIDPAKEADIHRLQELSGAAALATQMMDNMESGMRPLITNSLPPGAYREQLVDLFFQKFRVKRDPEQLMNLVAPVYDKYYSDDEIKGLIAFYQTPLGKKMLAVMPQVLSESQAAGQKWGGELGRQSMIEVLAEHPDLRRALEEAKATPAH